MKVRFRTGEREIPDHLAVMMHGIETRTMTFDEAVAAANRKQMSDYLNGEQNKIIKAHFTQYGRRGG